MTPRTAAPSLLQTRLVIAVLLAATLAACHTGSDSDGTATTGGATTVDTRENVLARLATELRTTINGLADPLKPHTAHRYLTGDDAGGCNLGDDADGPRRWNYTVALDVSLDDSEPEILAAAEILKEKGWSIQTVPTNPGQVERVARMDGASIGLVGGSQPTTNMLFQGFTACVSKDGAIDTNRGS